MTSNILAKLETANECSISGLFQELLNKGIKSTPHEPVHIGDSEGSDFKRLLHKKDKTEMTRKYHQDSPDFKPVIYLNNNSTSNRSLKFGNALYSFLFQHEDRYFNNDRDDLSKDIFPVGQQQAQ